MILITGAGGMLGRYVLGQFAENEVRTLGLKPENDYVCDLTKEIPDFNGQTFNTVIHLAGSEDDKLAYPLNLDGTDRIIKALKNPPENFVFVSSYRVYSQDAGENINEDSNTWADDDAGKSKARAEQLLRDWALKNDVTLTIIRPSRMFGNGVSGETLELFNDAIRGAYIHIRGNNAKVSLVTAYDVATVIKKLYDHGGVFNVSDGKPSRFIDMVESMTANAGAKKRMTHLPVKWGEWIWRVARWIPAIDRNLSPEVVARRMKTLTLDNSHVKEVTGIKFHDTIAVMEHTSPDYPYSYGETRQQLPKYEA